MKVSKDSLTNSAIERMVAKGYEIIVEADSEWVEIRKVEPVEEQTNAAI